jgi:glycosyltransferase involved in cell wall biosynthesis
VRILYVIDSLVPSGAERSLAALAPEYRRLGVALDVAYLQDRPGLHAELEAAGATLFCIAGPGGRIGWVRRLRRLIVDRRPDLVHTTLAEADLAGRVAARLAATPVVSSLVNVQHGPQQLDDPRVPRWKLQAAKLADQVTARGVVRFHAITRFLADVMARTLRIRRDRIDVVPRGRPAGELGSRSDERRRRARESLRLEEDTTLLVSVARQDRQKGLDILLRALPAAREGMPDLLLALAGREGNMTEDLRALVEELRLGEAVRFLGLREDVPELLCAADVFVLPSRWEGLGSVLLEAMALEVPIVASDIPPVREVVDEGTALLVPVERPAELGSAILEASRDRPATLRRAALARRRFLEEFTIEPVAEAMLAFYRRALSG